MGSIVLLLLGLITRFMFEWQLASRFQAGEKVKLNFCLDNQPYQVQNSQVFYYQNHFQKIKISLPLEKEFNFGDCLQIIGEIDSCQNQSTEGFCLINSSVFPFEENIGLKKNSYKLLQDLYKVREKLSNFFLRNLPYPEADLLSGIVLGVKQTLDPLFYEALKITGTLHIIVASGYNLSVISKKPINYLSYLFGRRIAIFLGFLLVWFYVGIVGFQPPVVRAAIMISFLYLGQFLGKKADQYRVFVATTWSMLMIKPDLITNISFQLSITALLGVLLGERLFTRLERVPVVGGDLRETLSAQLLVTPVIAYHFSRISTLAPLTNVLILPFVPYIMILGLFSLILSWIPFVGSLIVLLSYPLLHWIVIVIEKFSLIPGSNVSFNLNIYQLVAIYGVIFYFLKRKWKKEEK